MKLQLKEEKSLKLLGRHRLRANFYHMVSLVFLLSTLMWAMGLLTDKGSYIITAVLFTVDYIAEMYDPHPKSPGPWYSYFHRVWDFDDRGKKRYIDECNCCTC